MIKAYSSTFLTIILMFATFWSAHYCDQITPDTWWEAPAVMSVTLAFAAALCWAICSWVKEL